MSSTRLAQLLLLTIVLLSPLSVPVASSAQENSEVEGTGVRADAEGCGDLAFFRRLPLSVIVSCHSGSSVELNMPLSPDAQGYARSKTVHGAYEFREYQIPPLGQPDQAFDKLMMLLPVSGFAVKYSSNPSTITARNGDVWVLINVNGEFYDVSAVKEDPWIPVKDAAGIAREMDAHSRVAVYGIAFAPDNQSVVDEKSRILGEVLKYLNDNPDIVVVIESHKMSLDGDGQTDQETTAKRAQTVVAWLEAHGIAANRLQPKPFGRSNPLTENGTPLEVRENDRIELAKASS
jgi:outer membrane protein OmpA-like peptidoglycan-associated protein